MENVIYRYTAEQAVEDGVLVNVPDAIRKEAGFKWPVRITATVHDLCTPPESNTIESYDGRLWDVLWMAGQAIRQKDSDERDLVEFSVLIGRKRVTLWAAIDGTSGPAIHLMTPEDY